MTLGYGRQWINDDDIAEVVKVLRGDWLTMGPTVDAFEKSLAEYAGVKHAVTFSSGTAALHGAMHASGMGAGDFAVTTALTFVATSNSVIYTGATPIFADIDETFCMNPQEAERTIESHGGKVKAVIPVSFAGYPFDMAAFRTLADKYNAVLIEDASHAWGGRKHYDADMTTLSFHPVKHITTAEGGAVLTDNDTYDGVTRNPSEFVDEAPGVWHSEMQELGYNYRLSEVHCALGLSQMRRLDEFVERRRKIAEMYLRELSGVEGLVLPPNKEGHAWHLFIARVKEELHGEFFAYLRDNDIRLQVHYRPVPLQPYYRKKYGYKAGDFPQAEKYYSQAVSLPIFPLMTDDDVMRVCGAIKNFAWR